MAKNPKIKVIIDTNIFFSSIFFPNGNERQLFELADKGMWQIIICDYVFDEIQLVLGRKNIDPRLAVDLLDTYRNIDHMILDPDTFQESAEEAARLVSDKKDWPVYIFAKQEIGKDANTYLVSGDGHLTSEPVRAALGGRAMGAREFLGMALHG